MVEVTFDESVEHVGGCLFPVRDPLTGKKKPCGNDTPILDSNGNTRGFCAEHLGFIEEFTKHKMREANARVARGEKNRFPDGKFFRVGRVVRPIDRHMRII